MIHMKPINIGWMPSHSISTLWFTNLPSVRARPLVKARDTLTLGQLSFNVLHTPGHTPGHVVLHNAEHATVFVGDVLFNGAVGRYDFPGGNHADLMNSIKSQLW